MSDHDISLDEKRVYAGESGVETVFVAADMGVASVSVSGRQIGRFGLDLQCEARDVAAGSGNVAVAAAEGVFVDDGLDAGFQDTGFGPATAVTVHDGDVLAAADNGIVARFDGEWANVGRVDGTVHALDGDLAATDAGVVRIADDLEPAGLRDVADVSHAGVPHAAAADALYRLGNGWLDVETGDFRLVAADLDDAEPGRVGRAHAATTDTLYEHDDGDWTPLELPVDDTPAAVAHGDSTYVATGDGTLCLRTDDGDWRHRSLGLRGVTGLAVPR